MNKKDLVSSTNAMIESTRDVLDAVYETLNKGQREKILKNDKVKKLFDIYEVKT